MSADLSHDGRCGYEWGPVENEVTPCGTPVRCPHECKRHPDHNGGHYCCDTYVEGDDWLPAPVPASDTPHEEGGEQ